MLLENGYDGMTMMMMMMLLLLLLLFVCTKRTQTNHNRRYVISGISAQSFVDDLMGAFLNQVLMNALLHDYTHFLVGEHVEDAITPHHHKFTFCGDLH